MKISVFLNRIPKTVIDNNEICFENKKSEVIFYYIILRGKVSRSGLAYLLWPDSSENAAKKNLRNQLYYIGKTIGVSIFSTSKDVLSIDNNIDVEIIADVSENRILEGASLPGSEEIQSFFADYQKKHTELYLKENKKQIDISLNEKSETKVLSALENIIKIDPYGEESYRKVMLFYLNSKFFNKGINLYQKLKDVLEEDLNIQPEEETSNIFNMIISQKRELQSSANKYFYGRKDETVKINEQFYNFANDLEYRNCILTGGIGTGKTLLMNRISSSINNNCIIKINLTCFEVENDFGFKTIYKFLKQVLGLINDKKIKINETDIAILKKFLPFFSDESVDNNEDDVERIAKISYIQFEEAFSNICQKLTYKNKLLITVDDIHNIDYLSLRLLSHLFTVSYREKIWLFATCRKNQTYKILDLSNVLLKNNDLLMIEVGDFSSTDVDRIIKERVKDNANSNLAIKLYRETKGNPLFLFEYIDSIINDKISINEFKFFSIFKNKYEMLSDLNKKVLSTASTFFDSIDYRIISNVLKLDEMVVLEALDELVRSGCMLEEHSNNDSSISFFHEKFREYIYGIQSGFILKKYHYEIAVNIEASLTGTSSDYLEYNRLVYHYKYCGDKIKYLEYMVKKYGFLLNPNIEYPEYISSITNDDLINLNKEIDELDRDNDIWINFQIIKGSYEIKNCMYEEGKKSILSAIENTGSHNFLYNAYNQMIYYSIQIRDLELMNYYINRVKDLLEKEGSTFEEGKLKRLSGLFNIMNGDYKKAEIELKESIEIFKHNKDTNLSSLNLASSYNYLGYIYKYKHDYLAAVGFYKKAIEICQNSNILTGQTVYYTNLGQSLYELGKQSEAKEYLLKSEMLHKKIFTIWSRPLTECYLALIYFHEGDYQQSYKYLESAIFYSNKLKNPYETSYVLKTMVLIKLECIKDKELNNLFSSILNNDFEYYLHEALDYFKKLNMSEEISSLSNIASEYME